LGNGKWVKKVSKFSESGSRQVGVVRLGCADMRMNMKKRVFVSAVKMSLLALTVSGFAIAQEEGKVEAEKPAPAEGAPVDGAVDTKADASYAMGYQMAKQLDGSGITEADISMADLSKGFEAALKGQEPSIPVERLQASMTALGAMIQKRAEEAAAKNLEAGKKFLEENGKKEGVITTPSGLQYEVLAKGGDVKFDAAKDEAKLFMVNYRGTLIDGTEFDKSPEGKPYPMTLQVVPGFREALTMMPVGAKWKVYIPSALGYAGESRGPKIGPNSTLIFELELVEIKDAPKQEQEIPLPLPE
jgi:FKBP-type peptidyl-prolyl cis-trans isomerase